MKYAIFALALWMSLGWGLLVRDCLHEFGEIEVGDIPIIIISGAIVGPFAVVFWIEEWDGWDRVIYKAD